MKQYLANTVTGIRILGSILLALVPAFSASFYALYLLCGLSDMLDGTIARRTGSAGSFGARFDTIADVLFAAVSLVKLLSHLPVPGWFWGWIASIAAVKVCSAVVGLLRYRTLVSMHSVLNRLAGFSLFLLPLTFGAIELKYSAGIVCFLATLAATQECYYVNTGRTILMQPERNPTHKA